MKSSHLEGFPKMLAWVEKHDSHGLMLSGLVWLPEGDLPEPDGSCEYVRLPQFDTARIESVDVTRITKRRGISAGRLK